MVNNKNSIILDNFDEQVAYFETLNLIAHVARMLFEGGDSQFADFISLKHSSIKEYKLDEIKNTIKEFDFCLGYPFARQYTHLNMAYLAFKVSELVFFKFKHLLTKHLELNMNSINGIPSCAMKIVQCLVFLENKNPTLKNDIDNFFNISTTTKKNLSNKKYLTHKNEIKFSLKSWEEESIRKIFYSILNQHESLLMAFNYHYQKIDFNFEKEISNIKQNFFNIQLFDIYEKLLIAIISSISLIKSQDKYINQNNSDYKIYENKVFVERIGYQLSSLNEKKSEILTLQSKMYSILSENNIKFDELIDEEIHSINNYISKEKINLARLEMRLNDTEYPLSVVYRKYIMSLIENNLNETEI